MQFGGSRIIEIGGADQTSYGELMREYARQRGLKRLMIPVPVLSPRLSSLWLKLVTPYHSRVGKKLIEGLQNPTIVRNPEAAAVFRIQPVGLAESISRALAEEDREFSGAFAPERFGYGPLREGWAGTSVGNWFVDSRSVCVEQPREVVFSHIERIGGETGWYYGDWLWRLRGLVDQLIGGVGLRRGRRDPEKLVQGDSLDFWRVEALDRDRRLRLAAEMKLPGRAWLEFHVEGTEAGSILHQTAIFDPRGLMGLAYWYLLYPIHRLIFSGMLRKIARAAMTGQPHPAGSQSTRP
jgi:hypothetical protein